MNKPAHPIRKSLTLFPLCSLPMLFFSHQSKFRKTKIFVNGVPCHLHVRKKFKILTITPKALNSTVAASYNLPAIYITRILPP